MEGSILSVTVIEARNLKSARMTGGGNPYVVLSLDDQQTQSTDPIIGNLSPVWNDIMSFDIMTGKETLIAKVFDRAEIGSDSFIGSCFVTLDMLEDQYKHDELL